MYTMKSLVAGVHVFSKWQVVYKLGDVRSLLYLRWNASKCFLPTVLCSSSSVDSRTQNQAQDDAHMGNRPRKRVKSRVSKDVLVRNDPTKPKIETNFWKKWRHTRTHSVYGDHKLVQRIEQLFGQIKVDASRNSENAAEEFEIKDFYIAPSTLLRSLETNASQIGGFSLDIFEDRYNFFLNCATVSQYGSICLSLTIPSCVLIDKKQLKNLHDCLVSHGCSFEETLLKYPHLASSDPLLLDRNLNVLKQIGVDDGQELNDILIKFPVLLYMEINSQVVELFERGGIYIGDSQSKIKNFLSPLGSMAVQSDMASRSLEQPELRLSGADAVAFLEKFNVSSADTFQKCPELFSLTNEQLESVLDALIGAPFFLELDDLVQLLLDHPEIYFQFSKPDTKKLIKLIQKLCLTNSRLYNLLSQMPGIFQNPSFFVERVRLLKSYGFTNKNIDELLSKKGSSVCFVDCDDSKAIPSLLEIYQRYAISPSQISTSAPVSLSQDSLEEVSRRLQFLSDVNPKQISEISLRKIIKMTPKVFVEDICGRSLDDYDLFLHKNTYI